MIEKLFNRQAQETEEHWVSISDVMAGLMVIFLFIAISYMVDANRKTDEANRERERLNKLKGKVANLLDTYRNLQRALSEKLQREFESDLVNWTGSLDMEILSIRFKKPFRQGAPAVPNSFKDVLRDFFPRYIAILTEYKDEIAEIRIEGHTSSEWFDRVSSDVAYYNNMKLSQDRARNVLQYVLEIADSRIIDHKEWIKKYLTANGLSSSQLVLNLNKNSQYLANSHAIVAMETGLSERIVRHLHPQVHQAIRNWQNTTEITREDIVKVVWTVPMFSKHEQAVIERAVSLLMENKEEARRVEFRVVTKSEKLIEEIKDLMKEFDKESEVK